MAEKILVIRLSSIGDILHASAVPRVLKKQFPLAEIHWLVRSDNLDLVGHNPHLSHVISYDRKTGFKGFRSLTEKLKTQNYTHIYDAHSNLRSFYLCARIKAPFFIRRHKPRFRRFALFWMRLNFFKNYNSVRSFTDPLKAWGVTDDGMGSELHLPPSVTEKIQNLFSDFVRKNNLMGETKFIAFAPSAAWPKKRWPLEFWKSLARSLLDQTQCGLAILGGPDDQFCHEITQINPQRILHLQGRLTLLESAAATGFCTTLAANDTGVLHMAEALGKNVVALIGPTPFGYPTRAQSIALEVPLWCKPCSKDGSGPCVNPVYQKCMLNIKPERVLGAVLEQYLRM